MEVRTHVGLIDVIVWPPVALTNSLLMKRPVGKVIFLPFGAVRSTLRSAMMRLQFVDENRRLLEMKIR